VYRLKRDYFKECEGSGLRLVDYKSQPAGYGLYTFEGCGHEQLIQYVHVREGAFRCISCYENERSEIYTRAGVKFVSDLCEDRDKNYKLVEIVACGHTQAIALNALKSSEFSCVTCKNNRWAEEASMHGLEVVGKGRDSRYLTYRLPCGHEQDFQRGNVKRGIFSCDICNGTKHGKDRKSYLYMLLIKRKNFEWIKIGYSLDIDRRVKQYQLIDGCSIRLVECIEFPNRKEVAAVESKIHSSCSTYSHDSGIMEAFMLGGYTECYKIDNYEDVINIFREEVENAKDFIR